MYIYVHSGCLSTSISHVIFITMNHLQFIQILPDTIQSIATYKNMHCVGKSSTDHL